MLASQLEVGMVINYRGSPATVVQCWKCSEDSDGFGSPIGCVIEWGEPKNQCHLAWEEDGETTDGMNGEPLALWGG